MRRLQLLSWVSASFSLQVTSVTIVTIDWYAFTQIHSHSHSLIRHCYLSGISINIFACFTCFTRGYNLKTNASSISLFLSQANVSQLHAHFSSFLVKQTCLFPSVSVFLYFSLFLFLCLVPFMPHQWESKRVAKWREKLTLWFGQMHLCVRVALVFLVHEGWNAFLALLSILIHPDPAVIAFLLVTNTR